MSWSSHQERRACFSTWVFDAIVKARAKGKSWPLTACIGLFEPLFLPMSQQRNMVLEQHWGAGGIAPLFCLCWVFTVKCGSRKDPIDYSLILQVGKRSHSSQKLLLWSHHRLISLLQVPLIRGPAAQVSFLHTLPAICTTDTF